MLVALALADQAFAQCASNASSCVTCHESQGKRPVLGSAAPWHLQHGFGDLCAAGHGGDAAANSKPALLGAKPWLVLVVFEELAVLLLVMCRAPRLPSSPRRPLQR